MNASHGQANERFFGVAYRRDSCDSPAYIHTYTKKESLFLCLSHKGAPLSPPLCRLSLSILSRSAFRGVKGATTSVVPIWVVNSGTCVFLFSEAATSRCLYLKKVQMKMHATVCELRCCGVTM